MTPTTIFSLRVDGALVGVGRVHDLPLREAGLDRLDHAAELVDPAEVVEAAALHLRRQVLDEVGAAERVDRVRDAGLVRDDLLGAQRELDGEVGRQRQRLVERVGVERVRAAEDAGQRLDRRAHDVVVGLLGRQRAAGRLRVEAAHPGARVLRAEALAHRLRPDAPRGAELGDLLEEVVVRVEEEGEPRRELVDRQPGLDAVLHVLDAVAQREGELLQRGRAGLADVVPGDRDRVPLRHVLRAEGELVRDRGASRGAAGRCTPSGRCTP